jgi:molecular chaperone DnaK
VFQGERKFTRDNKLLGNFRLSGIKRAMAGMPQIEVTFDIDANGIVNVSAKDLGTGHEQSITITSSSNLSESEIERAKWDAQMYEKQDAQRGEFLQIRNDAEQLVSETERKLTEHKKDWDKKKRKQIKEDVSSLKKTVLKTPPEKMDATAADLIRQAKERLEGTLRTCGE